MTKRVEAANDEESDSSVAAAMVGVGPWLGDWPDDPRFDPELLRDGDRRNVVDRYRYWSHDAIVADLDVRRHRFHVAIENWEHDFNIGTVVRNANAFLAAEVHIVGKRKWNRRGAMVTDRYQHVRHHPEVADLVRFAAANDLALVGVDNLPGSVPIESTALPADCILVFGQEGPGLSDAVRDAVDLVVSISQFGSTRSINAGVASGIAMHEWVRQHGLDVADRTLDDVVSDLGLEPLPDEGGFFRRTHFDEYGSVILYVLGGEHVSRMHRLDGPETWYHHAGAPVELLVIDSHEATTVMLGSDSAAGHVPQYTVPAGAHQGALSMGRWSLTSTSMAPRYDERNFALSPIQALIVAFPAISDALSARS